MRERIIQTWSKDELDCFLMANYGHSYANFELSYLMTFVLFQYFNIRAKSYPALQKERRRLAKLKEHLVELFNDYLRGIDFYKHSFKHETFKRTGITKWTDENRRLFIQKYFGLEPALAIINKPDDWFLKVEMEDDIIPYGFGIDKGLRINPLNFLILVWSAALRRNSRVNWIDMSGLLSWLSENHDLPKLRSFYGLVKGYQIGEDVLRLTWNKYRQTRYLESARTQYRAFFAKLSEETLKSKLEELKGWVDSDLVESPEQYGKDIARFFILAALFPEVFSPIYDFLSTEGLEPKEVSEEEAGKIEKLITFIRSQYK